MFFFQITAVGRNVAVTFYGDNSTAELGRNNVFSINNKILMDAKKHQHKYGYSKALKEAFIDMARITIITKENTKCAAVAVSRNQFKPETKHEVKTRGCITRSQTASKLHVPFDVQGDTISGQFIRSDEKKTKQISAKDTTKQKNCVRRSARLRAKAK